MQINKSKIQIQDENLINLKQPENLAFIKSVLDASEQQNKNLLELVSIQKKNIEDLKQQINIKNSQLTKQDKEIQAFKQNEQRYTQIIKHLKDSIQQCLQNPQNSKEILSKEIRSPYYNSNIQIDLFNNQNNKSNQNSVERFDIQQNSYHNLQKVPSLLIEKQDISNFKPNSLISSKYSCQSKASTNVTQQNTQLKSKLHLIDNFKLSRKEQNTPLTVKNHSRNKSSNQKELSQQEINLRQLDSSNIHEDIDEAANLKILTHFQVNLHNDQKNKQNIFFENDIESKENYKIQSVTPNKKINSHSSQSQIDHKKQINIQKQHINFNNLDKNKNESLCKKQETPHLFPIKKSNQKTKTDFKESNEKEIGSTIFESFMVFGADKQDLIQNQNQSKHKIFNVNPKICFRYPDNLDSHVKEQDLILSHFAFPFGVESQEIFMTDSLSQVNEIIFSNNIAESNNNCFVFVVKSEQSFESKLQQKKRRKGGKNGELLEASNPSQLLYAICFKIKDVVDNSQKDSSFITQKLFCFFTYYSFIKFFLDVIALILNQMKIQKIQNFQNINQQFLENDFFINFLNTDCKKLLSQLIKIQLPSLNSILEFSHNNEQITYIIPNKEYARYIEADWNSSIVLSNLDEEIFSLIFLAILSEYSIVFVSHNSALLSCTLLVFHALLKPFKYPHPLIFNLPENIMHILDSPFPILVGINQDRDYIIDNQLSNNHQNCTFIILDDTIEILNYELISILKKGNNVKTFKNLLGKVQREFQLLNNNLPQQVLNGSGRYESASKQSDSSFILSAQNAVNHLMGSKQKNLAIISKRKQLIVSPTSEEKEICKRIFYNVSDFIRSEILDYLPAEASYLGNDKKVLDILFMSDGVIKSKGYDDSFMKKFTKTQLFTYYLEDRFLNNHK